MLAQQALSRSSALRHPHRLPFAPAMRIRHCLIISKGMTAELLHQNISMLVSLCRGCMCKEQLRDGMRFPLGLVLGQTMPEGQLLEQTEILHSGRHEAAAPLLVTAAPAATRPFC